MCWFVDGNLAGDSLTGQVQGEVHFFIFPESNALIFLSLINKAMGRRCFQLCLFVSQSFCLQGEGGSHVTITRDAFVLTIWGLPPVPPPGYGTLL